MSSHRYTQLSTQRRQAGSPSICKGISGKRRKNKRDKMSVNMYLRYEK